MAEGSRAERLRQNGCTINGQVYHPQVWTPQQAHGVDLLIVSLKYGALPGALDSIRTIVSERTVVMSLMNGVDSEELIAAQVGAAHVLPALIKVASHRTEDGVRFDPETTIGIIYGELTAPFDSDRVQAVRALFADAGIHFRVTEHIREEIWSKFRLNVCNNLPQAILGAGWRPLPPPRGSTSPRQLRPPPTAAPCRQPRATPPCRTSTPGGTQKSICSPVRSCAWGASWASRRPTTNTPTT